MSAGFSATTAGPAVARRPRIALIHALAQSIDPIAQAFARGWPEAEPINLLDDSLSVDRIRAGELAEGMVQRFLALGRYARACDVQGILFTCSAFGPAIEAVARDLSPLPVHRPNDGAIEAALRQGRRVGLLASFAPTLQSMPREFPAAVELETRYCPGALEALERGDGASHDRIAAEAARSLADCDCILLAQFSLARAAEAVAAATGRPVLTTPDWAVRKLRGDVDAFVDAKSHKLT